MTVASNPKEIFVYENFNSTEPNFLGTLFVEKFAVVKPIPLRMMPTG